MAIAITFGNFKGGTGKTTNSSLIAYILSNLGYKTLLIDLDPQGNATTLYLKTKQRISHEVVKFEKTLMSAISDNDLKSIITPVKQYLDLLPSYADFTSFPLYLEQLYPDNQKERAMHLRKLLAPVKDNYDFIIIDVPPTVSVYTDNALMVSDYTVIVMQTQERSMDGAKAYIIYLQELIDNFGADFDILGVLPVLLKNSSNVDKTILKMARKEFGEENMFSNVVKNMERLKRYDVTGIGAFTLVDNADVHDKRVFELYENVTKELIDRLKDRGVI